MAKRLEDFIIQSQDQNAMLVAEVTDLKNLLALKEQQLASATFRYKRSTIKQCSEHERTYSYFFVFVFSTLLCSLCVVHNSVSH